MTHTPELLAVGPWRGRGSPWQGPSAGHLPWPLPVAALLAPLIALWTLPQTLAGLGLLAWRRAQGYPIGLYGFGPFLFLVVPSRGFASSGISLGLVVFATQPSILTHEFCHLYTGLWLGWLYLPVYGLEYILFGHDGSPHERLTCTLERRSRSAWTRVGGASGTAP